MSNIIHGKNLIVSVDGTAVAAAKSCEISRETEMIETCSVTSGADKEFYPGKSSWGVTVNFFVIDPGVVIYTNQKVTLSCNGSTLGDAYVKSCQITGTVGNLCQGVMSFQGTGAMGGSSSQT
jgi:hypothetical protein